MFSNRAVQAFLETEDFLASYYAKTSLDMFDPELNRCGYVNVGTAVNALLEGTIENWLNQDGTFLHEKSWQHYHQFRLLNNINCFQKAT